MSILPVPEVSEEDSLSGIMLGTTLVISWLSSWFRPDNGSEA